MLIEDKLVNRIDELINKGDSLIANDELYSSVNYPSFVAWRVQILNLLTQPLGKDNVYIQEFNPKGKSTMGASEITVRRYQEILRALKEDILGGYITDVKTLISAEVFDDFLDMADHLLECGYKDPVASLCGAVLENGLGRIAANADIELRPIEGLSSLNSKCLKAEIYSRLLHLKIQTWTDIRNNADHGQFNEYSESNVHDMLKGVRQFLEDHLR